MLTNIELGAYLKQIRENKEISLREVEKLTNIGYSHLSMIENGKRNVTPALLRNLAKVYGVDYLDLYEKAGYIDLIENEKKDAQKNIFLIPVLGKIAAGQPILAEQYIEGYLPIDPNIYGMSSPDDYFYLRVSGESMNLKISNGDYALIQKQNTADDGDIIAAIINGDEEATLKKYKRINEETVALEPMSTFQIDTIYVNLKEKNFRIIGKAIGKFGKF